MADMQGQPGELRFTLQITRKETGITEEVEMVGYADPEDLKKFLEAQQTEQEK